MPEVAENHWSPALEYLPRGYSHRPGNMLFLSFSCFLYCNVKSLPPSQIPSKSNLPGLLGTQRPPTPIAHLHVDRPGSTAQGPPRPAPQSLAAAPSSCATTPLDHAIISWALGIPSHRLWIRSLTEQHSPAAPSHPVFHSPFPSASSYTPNHRGLHFKPNVE